MKFHLTTLGFFFLTLPCLGAPELSGGIVFPGIGETLIENPSYLPLYPTRSLQLLISPVLNTSGMRFNQWGVSLLRSQENGWGYGFTYRARGNTHGLYGTGAYKIEGVSIGLTLREEALENDFTPSADLGISVALTERLLFAFVMNELNHHPALAAGFGYTKPYAYSIELNLRAPSVASDGKFVHNQTTHPTFCFHGTYYFSRLGVSYGVEYEMRTPEWKQVWGLLYRFSPKFSVTGELSHPLDHRFLLTYQF